MGIYWYLYLAGVALCLALVVTLRRLKLDEDGPENDPLPWWFYLACVLAAAAWPLLLGLVVVLSVVD